MTDQERLRAALLDIKAWLQEDSDPEMAPLELLQAEKYVKDALLPKVDAALAAPTGSTPPQKFSGITQQLRGRPVTHQEALDSAQRLINSHFNNPDQARISIPVRPDNDDVTVMDYIIEQRDAELARASAPVERHAVAEEKHASLVINDEKCCKCGWKCSQEKQEHWRIAVQGECQRQHAEHREKMK